MTFYDDSKPTYSDEMVFFTIQHETTGHHLYGKHNEKPNLMYNKIVWNATMTTIGQHLKSSMYNFKVHNTYRQASKAIDERFAGYKLYQHWIRTDVPENKDIVRLAIKDAPSSAMHVWTPSQQLRISSHKVTEDMVEDLYKFRTEEVPGYNILDNVRNLLFNNYFTSAGVLKEIPWADYHHIADRKQFNEVKEWTKVYAVEANLDHFKTTIDMVNGKHLVLQTLVKLPLGIILLEDKKDANLFSLMNTDARLNDITGLVKRMMQHRICE